MRFMVFIKKLKNIKNAVVLDLRNFDLVPPQNSCKCGYIYFSILSMAYWHADTTKPLKLNSFFFFPLLASSTISQIVVSSFSGKRIDFVTLLSLDFSNLNFFILLHPLPVFYYTNFYNINIIFII